MQSIVLLTAHRIHVVQICDYDFIEFQRFEQWQNNNKVGREAYNAVVVQCTLTCQRERTSTTTTQQEEVKDILHIFITFSIAKGRYRRVY